MKKPDFELDYSNYWLYEIRALNNYWMRSVEHDIMNYQNRGLCPKPKAEADNTETRF